MVRTPPFHGGNRGSNPLRVAKIPVSLARLGFCFVTGWESNPVEGGQWRSAKHGEFLEKERGDRGAVVGDGDGAGAGNEFVGWVDA